jgi:hypothetical protein
VRISGLKQFRKNRAGGRYFEDLPWPVQREARRWLWKFRQRWGRNLPVWRFAILVGQAKRLALNPPSSGWGRKMLAKRGGKAAQRKYQFEGQHPTQAATQARYWKRKAAQRAKAEADERQRLGMDEAAKVAYLPLP